MITPRGSTYPTIQPEYPTEKKEERPMFPRTTARATILSLLSSGVLALLLLAAWPARPGLADDAAAGPIYLPVIIGGSGGTARITPPDADFNGDGFADLVIGVPFEDVGDATDAGAAHVIYGTVFGLNEADDQIWDQDVDGVEGSAETRDNFSLALGAGDFNGDTFVDLAVGVPGETQGDDEGTGVVNVLYGSAFRLTSNGDQLWDQEVPDVEGANESGDRFGDELTTGDFNGDGFQDLAVGVPDENVGEETNAGSVQVIFGSTIGLTSVGNQLWHQDSDGIDGSAEDDDRFGSALAAGDFNGDGYEDLAVGVPLENRSGEDNAGTVHVLFGFGGGLTAIGSQRFDQDTPGIPNGVEEDDEFGDALVAADFNGDGFADLAIGVPGEDIADDDQAGSVIVIYGSEAGLNPVGSQFWNQDTLTILDDVDGNDRFGRALAAGDFNGDGFAELAIGVPEEDVDDTDNAGAVNVIYGSAVGLVDLNNQLWTLDTPGIQGSKETSGQFGRALTTGDYNGDGFGDLAVGTPGQDVGGAPNSGAVNVIYGSAIGLTTNLNQRWSQDTAGIGGTPELDDFFGRVLR
jgi:hypothetical protein